MLLDKSTVLMLLIVTGRCQNGKRRRITQCFAPGTPRRKHLAHGYDFLPVGGFIPGVSSNSRHKRPGRSQDGWARREHPIFTTNPVFFEPLRCELLPISWTEKSVTY